MRSNSEKRSLNGLAARVSKSYHRANVFFKLQPYRFADFRFYRTVLNYFVNSGRLQIRIWNLEKQENAQAGLK